MVTEQSARDAAVFATFVLVLMVQWKGVTGDNLRRSRETSWDDDVLELEASREPFRNDEEFVGDSLQQELRGSEQPQNVDNAFGDQEIPQDLQELDPEVQEDQLSSEGEDGARTEETELESQDDQQLQVDKFTGKENNEDEAQHMLWESTNDLALQQQKQQLPNDDTVHDKAHPPMEKMEESRQLQKEQPLSVEKGDTSRQRAQQEVEVDQQPQQKSPNKEIGSIRFRQAGADEKDKQQLPQERLTSAEKNSMVVKSGQPKLKEERQLQQEQLPKGDTEVLQNRLQTRDSHELQQEVLSKEGNNGVRAQHTPIEMEDVNWKLPHVSVSNEQKDEVRAQRAELETKQKWKMQGQQLSNEEGGGKTYRHVKFGTEANHQQKDLQNEERGEVENYPRKMDAGDILQGNQNQFDSGHTGAVSSQHGQMEATSEQKLQQEKGKDSVNDQLDVNQLQLRHLAAFGRIVDSVSRNQEVGKQIKPDEIPGNWMKPTNVGKEAAFHSGPSGVEKSHPNENNALANSEHGDLMSSERLATSKQLKADEIPGAWMLPGNVRKVAARPSSDETLHPNEKNVVGNSDHVELVASDRLVSSKQRTESKGPAAVRDDILMSPSDTAEKDLMRTGEDELQPRASIGTSGSIGWEQPSKVGEAEARVSDTHHIAEQWLQTSGSKSAVQELPVVGHGDRPAGVETRQRPQDEFQGGMERQHLRKPVDGSHRAHIGKVKKRTRNKASSKEQQRARRRNKAAAAASRAQRQHRHKALPRPQRQQWPKQFEPGDMQSAADLSSMASSERPEGSLVVSVTLPESLELVNASAINVEPVGKVAVVLVSSPPEQPVGLPSISATVPSLEVDVTTTVPSLEVDVTTTVNAGINAIVSASISVNTSANTNVSTSENINDTTSGEPLPPVSSERDAVAQRVVQGVQRRAQQSERLRQQILPALRSSPPSGQEAGGQAAACNESAPCQRRRLLERALRAVQQLRRLEEQGEPCPAPAPPDRACLRQLLQFAPGPAAGPTDISRRIRHLRRLVADYEKLTAAEKRQVQGVRDYLARQLSRLYNLSQAATPQPVAAREVTEEPQARGKEAAAAALLERLQRHGQLPPRPLAFQHRLQRRLASRHRRDAYAQLALSAAKARFHMPAA